MSSTLSRNNKMSQLYQNKSKKLMKLAKKNERLNSMEKACTYYAQSLNVLGMALYYGVACQDPKVQDLVRSHFKVIQRFMTQLSLPDMYQQLKSSQENAQIPSEEYFLANLDKHVSVVKIPSSQDPKPESGTGSRV